MGSISFEQSRLALSNAVGPIPLEEVKSRAPPGQITAEGLMGYVMKGAPHLGTSPARRPALPPTPTAGFPGLKRGEWLEVPKCIDLVFSVVRDLTIGIGCGSLEGRPTASRQPCCVSFTYWGNPLISAVQSTVFVRWVLCGVMRAKLALSKRVDPRTKYTSTERMCAQYPYMLLGRGIRKLRRISPFCRNAPRSKRS